MTGADPRAACLIGVATRTWRPEEVGDSGAPEPLAMWAEMLEAAAADSGAGGRALEALGSLAVVHCQTWQYDDPAARLAERLRVAPRRRVYSGMGGTVPYTLVHDAAEAMRRGDLDVAAVVSGEALATRRARKRRGEPYRASFPAAERNPFPFDVPFHPAEVAHEVFQAYLTFACFDNARRAHLGMALDDYRRRLGELWARCSEVAAANPDAWFPRARTLDELVTPGPENRMVAYPYTKWMVAIMDVDMAAALLLATHETAERLGVPPDRRVYLRGAGYAEDPAYVAEHDEMWRSPAMAHAGRAALGAAGIGIDDVGHLDLYSCFGSSLHFAADASGLDPTDPRGLTVTGGLPYHGGPGSGYGTHALATLARRLRADPGSHGLASGVGMHMTKHAFSCWSTVPPRQAPPPPAAPPAPVRRPLVDRHDGPATVVAYTVLHDRDGAPTHAVLVAELPDGARCYARTEDPERLAAAETRELVGGRVRLRPDERGVNRVVGDG